MYILDKVASHNLYKKKGLFTDTRRSNYNIHFYYYLLIICYEFAACAELVHIYRRTYYSTKSKRSTCSNDRQKQVFGAVKYWKNCIKRITITYILNNVLKNVYFRCTRTLQPWSCSRKQSRVLQRFGIEHESRSWLSVSVFSLVF